MHAWGKVDLRIYLAQKNHGHSISAQSYDFRPCLTKLDILDFTLSHTVGQTGIFKQKKLSPLYFYYTPMHVKNIYYYTKHFLVGN